MRVIFIRSFGKVLDLGAGVRILDFSSLKR
jgi:hypothetical protein